MWTVDLSFEVFTNAQNWPYCQIYALYIFHWSFSFLMVQFGWMFNNSQTCEKAIYCIKQCSDQAKANIFFDVCRLFFDLFHLFFDPFRFRVRSVWTGPYSYVNVITPLIFELLFSWKMFFFHFSSSKWLDDFLRQDNYQRRKRERWLTLILSLSDQSTLDCITVIINSTPKYVPTLNDFLIE